MHEVMQGTANGRHSTRVHRLTCGNIEQKFEIASTDTRTPGVMRLQHVWYHGSDSLTFYQTFTLGRRTPPLSGQTVRLRSVLRMDGPDRHTLPQYRTWPTARELLAIE